MKLVFHDRFLEHRQRGDDHPESPERLVAIRDRLQSEGLWRDVLAPRPAPLKDCLRIHRQNYLNSLAKMGEGVWDRDTYVRPETLAIARLAAGGAILAADAAWQGRETAWALLRPPGHHAIAGSAMGFCYLNNVAIAAARHVALGRGRVAIVDVDVHHGNGTQEAFYGTADVLTISMHEAPLFPGTGAADETGAGAGQGYNLNIPVPAGSGDATYGLAMERLIEPAVRRFAPSLILSSFGTDIHYLDPLAGLTMSSQACVGLVERIEALAGQVCEGRVAFMLEGGYHLGALAEIVAAAAGGKVPLHFTEVRDERGVGASIVGAIAERLKLG